MVRLFQSIISGSDDTRLVMEKTVCQRATDSFMKQDHHQADFDSFMRKPVGVVATIAGNQFPGFHFSQVVAELVF